jgi:hypothetical protein
MSLWPPRREDQAKSVPSLAGASPKGRSGRQTTIGVSWSEGLVAGEHWRQASLAGRQGRPHLFSKSTWKSLQKRRRIAPRRIRPSVARPTSRLLSTRSLSLRTGQPWRVHRSIRGNFSRFGTPRTGLPASPHRFTLEPGRLAVAQRSALSVLWRPGASQPTLVERLRAIRSMTNPSLIAIERRSSSAAREALVAP